MAARSAPSARHAGDASTAAPGEGASRRPGSTSRRVFLARAGLGLSGLLAAGPALTACAARTTETSTPTSSAATARIGFVSPRTGGTAGSGDTDGYVVDLARAALIPGITVNRVAYAVDIIDADSRSGSLDAAQVAHDLITGTGIHLMLTTSGADTVNRVAEVCETAGVPCISTGVPWNAWHPGRGATRQKPFRYTYHFAPGDDALAGLHRSLWPQVPTNRKVGLLWPDGEDDDRARQDAVSRLRGSGYAVVDVGYTPGGRDFAAAITRLAAADCEILDASAMAGEFTTFWQQAAGQGYRPKIAQVDGELVPGSRIESLGRSGVGVAGTAYWTPSWPYTSPLTGLTSRHLGDGYQRDTGRRWSQHLGPSLALFDVAVAALQASGAPLDRSRVARAVADLTVDTTVGRLAWGRGPVPNVVVTPLTGGQWVPAPPGSRYELDFAVCENSTDPQVPVTSRLAPIT